MRWLAMIKLFKRAGRECERFIFSMSLLFSMSPPGRTYLRNSKIDSFEAIVSFVFALMTLLLSPISFHDWFELFFVRLRNTLLSSSSDHDSSQKCKFSNHFIWVSFLVVINVSLPHMVILYFETLLKNNWFFISTSPRFYPEQGLPLPKINP